ncbi:MAG: hypothetical protein IJH64_00415 [Oscillospiraceae bacterium]|nr:hypothetical protein [Oscillospiraceae bacterium]
MGGKRKKKGERNFLLFLRCGSFALYPDGEHGTPYPQSQCKYMKNLHIWYESY